MQIYANSGTHFEEALDKHSLFDQSEQFYAFKQSLPPTDELATYAQLVNRQTDVVDRIYECLQAEPCRCHNAMLE